MKKISLKILGVLIVVILILQSTVVIAASSVSELNNEKQQNQDKINNAKEQKDAVTEQKNQTVKEVESLSTQITSYEAQIEELDSKISELNGQIKESQNKLDKAQEDYTKQEDLLEKRLVTIQEKGDISYLDFILSSNSLTELISNYYLVTELAQADTELLQQIQKQKEEIQKAKETLEASKKELDTSKASKQSVSVQLKTAKAEKDKQVAQLSEDEKAIQKQIDELNNANTEIDKKIIALSQSKNNNSGGGTTPPSASGFIYPVPSGFTRITTGIYYSSGQYHGAVDFGSAGINGQPVYAVADGEVIISTRLSGSYGNYIIIQHDNGLFTLYAHGQDGSRTVSAGQRVKQGQQIMRVGTTGNSTGPHLHFEVRTSPGTYSCRRDPSPYLH